MLAILGGIIPLLTKGVQEFLTSKKVKAEQAFELEKFQLELKARNELMASTASSEVLKAEMEAKKMEFGFETERQKTIAATQQIKSGVKWIDASINLVRALFGFGAVFIFLFSAYNLWKTGSAVLTQVQFSQVFIMIVCYFFAERSTKKAWGGE